MGWEGDSWEESFSKGSRERCVLRSPLFTTYESNVVGCGRNMRGPKNKESRSDSVMKEYGSWGKLWIYGKINISDDEWYSLRSLITSHKGLG